MKNENPLNKYDVMDLRIPTEILSDGIYFGQEIEFSHPNVQVLERDVFLPTGLLSLLILSFRSISYTDRWSVTSLSDCLTSNVASA